jgi:predicted porin
MKKLLLGTSALISAATMIASVAVAEDPKVTIGGFSTFEAGYTKSDKDSGLNDHTFRNNNEIHFNVSGKHDSGLVYGAEIDLNADIDGAGNSTTNSGQTSAGLNARRTYGYLQGDQWGHLEYGSNDSAARTLKVDAASIARATGGIDGDWTFFADTNTAGAGSAGTFAGSSKFITLPRLASEHGPSTGFGGDLYSNPTKITYYTPRFTGFQLGVSYTPSVSNRGQINNRQDSASVLSNVWSGGLNYENQFDGLGVAASVTGETGTVETAAAAGSTNNVKSWNAGAKLSYMGVSAAGSYGDWDESFAANGTNANYWTAGLAYENGPVGVSATYLNSKTELAGINADKFQNVSVGLDYKLAPGLTPFIEYTYYDINDNAAGNDNKGNVVLVGSQLAF